MIARRQRPHRFIALLGISAIAGVAWEMLSSSSRLSAASADITRRKLDEGLATQQRLASEVSAQRNSLNAAEVSRETELRVIVTDTMGRRLVGSRVRAARDLRGLLELGEAAATTDAQGEVRVAAPRDEGGALLLPWLLVEHDTLLSVLLAPNELATHRSDPANGGCMVTIALEPPLAISVVVRDRLNRPVPRASVSVQGRWGDDLRSLVHGADHPLLRVLSPTVDPTDSSGHAIFSIDARLPYRMIVDAGCGMRRATLEITEAHRQAQRIDVTLDAIAIAGLRLPRNADGEVIRTGFKLFYPQLDPTNDGLESSLELHYDLSNHKRCGDAVARRLGIEDDVCWILAAEIDARLAEQPKPIRVCMQPGQPEATVMARFRNAAEFRSEDIAVLPEAASGLPTGELQVRFEGASCRGDLLSEARWRIESCEDPSFDHHPDELAARDRPDFGMQRDHYRFVLPAGSYRLMLSLRGEQQGLYAPEPGPIQVEAGRSTSIVCKRVEENRAVPVRFEVTDTSGRLLRCYDVSIGGVSGGVLATNSGEAATLLSGFRLQPGMYSVLGSAYGFRDIEPLSLQVLDSDVEKVVRMCFEPLD